MLERSEASQLTLHFNNIRFSQLSTLTPLCGLEPCVHSDDNVILNASEESQPADKEILRFAQNDSLAVFVHCRGRSCACPLLAVAFFWAPTRDAPTALFSVLY